MSNGTLIVHLRALAMATHYAALLGTTDPRAMLVFHPCTCSKRRQARYRRVALSAEPLYASLSHVVHRIRSSGVKRRKAKQFHRKLCFHPVSTATYVRMCWSDVPYGKVKPLSAERTPRPWGNFEPGMLPIAHPCP
jgi:hypothetical protein